ncbi:MULTISPECIES: DUF502 domain-containing protein [Photobacterium]|uniref:DUF502 domain-containing protein n=1 Tax=Photobacterium TaxID=657 RepID=UPI00136EE780|nr:MULTISPECIES: DUF502 domain-containing protein [Photobacterium]MBP2700972.1 DUF502 domain-containing protein [Vibrio parahaemolyticus]MZG56305.1 DUF502 domain-containing protein [Photobacterium lucens]MZG82121.1 DUF502 domain-containing protein [Photobacterium lucens]
MKKTLLRGLLNVLPLVLSIWLFWSLFESLDKVGNFLFGLFHIGELFKGAGFLLILTLLFVAGLLFSVSPIAWLYDFIIRQLMRFPFFKTVYSSINDIASLISSDNKNKGQQTVLVRQANDSYVIGFIMSDDMPAPLAAALPDGDWVPVLFPLSYQIAGVTTLVKREDLTVVDWSFEEAMKYNLTAGISAPKNNNDKIQKETDDTANNPV